MTALRTDLRAALDQARAADPRPEALRLWDTLQKGAEKSDDPDGALLALCERLLIEVDKIHAERGVCANPRCENAGPHDECIHAQGAIAGAR